MGFYAPAQIVRDARDHGVEVEVRPVCINASRWDCTLEPIDDERFAVRRGLRMVRGLANKDGAVLVAARADRPFESIDDLWRRARISAGCLVELADADAMLESLGLARRDALWAIKSLRDEPLALFAAAAALARRPRASGGRLGDPLRRRLHKPKAMAEPSVRDRPWTTTETIFILTKSRKYHFNRKVLNGEEDVWSIPAPRGANRYKHAAPFPEALVERCLAARCPRRGTVPDPYAGSGTTLAVAAKRKLPSIGFELNPRYWTLARQRMVTKAVPKKS